MAWYHGAGRRFGNILQHAGGFCALGVVWNGVDSDATEVEPRHWPERKAVRECRMGRAGRRQFPQRHVRVFNVIFALAGTVHPIAGIRW